MSKLFIASLTAICSLVISQATFARDYSASEQANLAAAASFFDAFEAGDMDTAFSMMADDIVWYVNGDSRFVPHHGTWNGKAEVQEWLNDIVGAFEFLDFGYDEFFVDGDTVIALVHETDRAIATGKEITQSEVMIVSFNDEGKISQMRAFDDSASEHWALTPDEK